MGANTGTETRGAGGGRRSRERAERVEAALETPVLIAAALTLPSVVLYETHVGGVLETVAILLNWVTWLVFAIETVALLVVTPDRWAWIRAHPIELIVVILTPPVLPAGLQSIRALRLLRLLRLLKLAKLWTRIFTPEGLRAASLLAVVCAVAGGALFKAFEHGHQHVTTWDGIYWAATTMTTLGSNFDATTVGSQITAIVLMIVGVCFVAMLTGAIAQKFLSSLEEGSAPSESEPEPAGSHGPGD